MSEMERHTNAFRVVIVKDASKDWRPWRWAVEEERGYPKEWSLVASGCASRRGVAWRRAHRRAVALSHRTVREEALVVSVYELPKYEPPTVVASPLPPEHLEDVAA